MCHTLHRSRNICAFTEQFRTTRETLNTKEKAGLRGQMVIVIVRSVLLGNLATATWRWLCIANQCESLYVMMQKTNPPTPRVMKSVKPLIAY